MQTAVASGAAFVTPSAVSKPPYIAGKLAEAIDGPNLEALSLDDLRRAIRANRVSFPAQAPVFPKHDRPDLQWKFAQLYFVCGWNCRSIAARHGLIRQRVQQVLNTWKRRAVQMGYLQFIPTAEALEVLLVSTVRHRESVPESSRALKLKTSLPQAVAVPCLSDVAELTSSS